MTMIAAMQLVALEDRLDATVYRLQRVSALAVTLLSGEIADTQLVLAKLVAEPARPRTPQPKPRRRR
jgi:hypothetical protein